MMDTFQKSEKILTIYAPTIRIESPIPYANNLGLECYLGESLINSQLTDIRVTKEVNDSIKRLIKEAQFHRNCLFWGWEKIPSIEKIVFPIDWDDTAKAIDFINSSKDIIGQSAFDEIILPSPLIWKEELKKSIFETESVGEDIVLSCPHKIALSVFFGKKADEWEPRDDPMVTVATVRTTKLWFPNIADDMNTLLLALIKRASFILNHLLETSNHKFEFFSRYYFSFGHFAYRFLETTEMFGWDFFDFLKNQISLNERIQNADRIIFSNANDFDSDAVWWYLIGLKLKKVKFRNNVINFIENLKDVPIFRHRRMNHYYYAKNWLQRISYLELQSIIKSKLIEPLR